MLGPHESSRQAVHPPAAADEGHTGVGEDGLGEVGAHEVGGEKLGHGEEHGRLTAEVRHLLQHGFACGLRGQQSAADLLHDIPLRLAELGIAGVLQHETMPDHLHEVLVVGAH